MKLAEAYLTEHRKLWPELANYQILPEPTPDVIAEMVKDFQLRQSMTADCDWTRRTDIYRQIV